jgi:predicted dithiol-disulfide oxidoreductase (DUF899 family)
MSTQRVGTREEWLAARAALLEREKEHTRAGDESRPGAGRLPWGPLDKECTLQSGQGPKSLTELSDGRSQLIVYHFMFGPQYEGRCPVCSSTADGFDGTLPHLRACDVTMVCVSRAPLEALRAYRERMGWRSEWVSSNDSDFNFDFGVSAHANAQHEPLPEANELGALKRRRTTLRFATGFRSSRAGTRARPEPTSTATSRKATASAPSRSRTTACTTAIQPMGWLRRNDEYPDR